MDCVVLGASFDDPDANRAFRSKFEFPFRLLSDPDEQVGVAYEVRDAGPDPVGFARRLAYLIDPAGTIAKSYEVADVRAFSGQVLGDLYELREE